MKPSIYEITPFDAQMGTVVYYKWQGEQQRSNKFVVMDNSTGLKVYEEEQTSFQSLHVLKPNIGGLINGKTYKAHLQVTTMNGEKSEASSTVLFKCLTTPTWEFVGIVSNMVVQNSEITVVLNYQQKEQELLNIWKIHLYDNAKQELFNRTVSATAGLTTQIQGLTDRTHYYLRATGVTVSGVELDTGFVPISVTYSQKPFFSALELTNLPNKGAIQVKANFASLTGRVLETQQKHSLLGGRELTEKEIERLFKTEGNTTYLSLGEKQFLNFHKGFSIASSAFRIFLRVKNLKENVVFFGMTDNRYEILCQMRKTKVTKDSLGNAVNRTDYQIQVTINNIENSYSTSLWSNSFSSYDPNSWVTIKLQRDSKELMYVEWKEG